MSVISKTRKSHYNDNDDDDDELEEGCGWYFTGRHDNNVTLVLIVVVIVFSVCQFPALVTQLSWNFLPNEARLCGGFQFYFSRISNALVVTNSAVNFVIYLRFNKRFRSILRQKIPGNGIWRIKWSRHVTDDFA